jgi:hypothetical protein
MAGPFDGNTERRPGVSPPHMPSCLMHANGVPAAGDSADSAGKFGPDNGLEKFSRPGCPARYVVQNQHSPRAMLPERNIGRSPLPASTPKTLPALLFVQHNGNSSNIVEMGDAQSPALFNPIIGRKTGRTALVNHGQATAYKSVLAEPGQAILRHFLGACHLQVQNLGRARPAQCMSFFGGPQERARRRTDESPGSVTLGPEACRANPTPLFERKTRVGEVVAPACLTSPERCGLPGPWQTPRRSPPDPRSARPR